MCLRASWFGLRGVGRTRKRTRRDAPQSIIFATNKCQVERQANEPNIILPVAHMLNVGGTSGASHQVSITNARDQGLQVLANCSSGTYRSWTVQHTLSLFPDKHLIVFHQFVSFAQTVFPQQSEYVLACSVLAKLSFLLPSVRVWMPGASTYATDDLFGDMGLRQSPASGLPHFPMSFLGTPHGGGRASRADKNAHTHTQRTASRMEARVPRAQGVDV